MNKKYNRNTSAGQGLMLSMKLAQHLATTGSLADMVTYCASYD